MFREKRYKPKKKVKEADRKDPLKSHRPDLPVTGPGECSYELTLRAPFVFQSRSQSANTNWKIKAVRPN